MLSGGPPPEQVHLQFGADAASQMAVSWAAATAVARPRVRFSQANGGPIGEVHAIERGYTDALTGEIVYTYHAKIDSLDPDTRYGYEVVHDGAAPSFGTFRTGPRSRSSGFRFTSVGDQSIPAPVGLGLGPNSPNAGYVVDAIESLDPLFNLANGDLSYSNSTDQPVATWTSYFANIARSAAFRPWMPALGNHENEAGNGPQGYLGYLTRFELPGNGSAEFAGNWYAFTVGPVLVVSLSNDDVCLQDAGFSSYRRDHVPGYDALGVDPYIRGYSRGRQERWLARVLAAASQSDEIDWIIVCMHHVAMSSAHFNGADLGIRRHWLPLFDAYGVDLVLAGHEHHFERTFPVRGTIGDSELLTPAPRGGDSAEMDTSHGTVHLTIGGGGHPYNSPSRRLHGPGEGVVITEVSDGDPHRQRQPVLAIEPALWSAYQDDRAVFGFAAFDLVPVERGGTTSITVTYYSAVPGSADYVPHDTFVLRKQLRGEPAGQWTDDLCRPGAVRRSGRHSA
ncbi:MAG TPA: metallophosphoesterase family protein [Streptosporangiaceae bacterium]|nr:metallophosphoesterase family protein [Streptosporangiaceae bacterium]